ncbi:hypothetical protein BX600DRAFT_551147 [Xylariales sp. PMI_506]|nr:hypothetical protein BX600DRAFT_551147 [Xylariales sp. PMI_506]
MDENCSINSSIHEEVIPRWGYQNYTDGEPPLGFFKNAPPEALALFSTELGQKPRRFDKTYLDAPREIFPWDQHQIQSAVDELKANCWDYRKYLIRPTAYLDLYNYFDDYTLWHMGVQNAWNEWIGALLKDEEARHALYEWNTYADSDILNILDAEDIADVLGMDGWYSPIARQLLHEAHLHLRNGTYIPPSPNNQISAVEATVKDEDIYPFTAQRFLGGKSPYGYVARRLRAYERTLMGNPIKPKVEPKSCVVNGICIADGTSATAAKASSQPTGGSSKPPQLECKKTSTMPPKINEVVATFTKDLHDQVEQVAARIVQENRRKAEETRGHTSQQPNSEMRVRPSDPFRPAPTTEIYYDYPPVDGMCNPGIPGKNPDNAPRKAAQGVPDGPPMGRLDYFLNFTHPTSTSGQFVGYSNPHISDGTHVVPDNQYFANRDLEGDRDDGQNTTALESHRERSYPHLHVPGDAPRNGHESSEGIPSSPWRSQSGLTGSSRQVKQGSNLVRMSCKDAAPVVPAGRVSHGDRYPFGLSDTKASHHGHHMSGSKEHSSAQFGKATKHNRFQQNMAERAPNQTGKAGTQNPAAFQNRSQVEQRHYPSNYDEDDVPLRVRKQRGTFVARINQAGASCDYQGPSPQVPNCTTEPSSGYPYPSPYAHFFRRPDHKTQYGQKTQEVAQFRSRSPDDTDNEQYSGNRPTVALQVDSIHTQRQQLSRGHPNPLASHPVIEFVLPPRQRLDISPEPSEQTSTEPFPPYVEPTGDTDSQAEISSTIQRFFYGGHGAVAQNQADSVSTTDTLAWSDEPILRDSCGGSPLNPRATEFTAFNASARSNAGSNRGHPSPSNESPLQPKLSPATADSSNSKAPMSCPAYEVGTQTSRPKAQSTPVVANLPSLLDDTPTLAPQQVVLNGTDDHEPDQAGRAGEGESSVEPDAPVKLGKLDKGKDVLPASQPGKDQSQRDSVSPPHSYDNEFPELVPSGSQGQKNKGVPSKMAEENVWHRGTIPMSVKTKTIEPETGGGDGEGASLSVTHPITSTIGDVRPAHGISTPEPSQSSTSGTVKSETHQEPEPVIITNPNAYNSDVSNSEAEPLASDKETQITVSDSIRNMEPSQGVESPSKEPQTPFHHEKSEHANDSMSAADLVMERRADVVDELVDTKHSNSPEFRVFTTQGQPNRFADRIYIGASDPMSPIQTGRSWPTVISTPSQESEEEEAEAESDSKMVSSTSSETKGTTGTMNTAMAKTKEKPAASSIHPNLKADGDDADATSMAAGTTTANNAVANPKHKGKKPHKKKLLKAKNKQAAALASAAAAAAIAEAQEPTLTSENFPDPGTVNDPEGPKYLDAPPPDHNAWNQKGKVATAPSPSATKVEAVDASSAGCGVSSPSAPTPTGDPKPTSPPANDLKSGTTTSTGSNNNANKKKKKNNKNKNKKQQQPNQQKELGVQAEALQNVTKAGAKNVKEAATGHDVPEELREGDARKGG